MEEYAKLLTGVGALVGAVAWPVAFLVALFVFKDELRSVLTRVPMMLDRVKKASLAGSLSNSTALLTPNSRKTGQERKDNPAAASSCQ